METGPSPGLAALSDSPEGGSRHPAGGSVPVRTVRAALSVSPSVQRAPANPQQQPAVPVRRVPPEVHLEGEAVSALVRPWPGSAEGRVALRQLWR